MTEHPAFAALPVPCNAAFQEHSGAGSEQVHAVFGSGVQCFGPVIYQALCTSMLGKELSTGVVNMGLGEPGPRPSYVPAELSPVPEGYVPSAIDESAQQQKWGSRIGGEHQPQAGAEYRRRRGWRLLWREEARPDGDAQTQGRDAWNLCRPQQPPNYQRGRGRRWRHRRSLRGRLHRRGQRQVDDRRLLWQAAACCSDGGD